MIYDKKRIMGYYYYNPVDKSFLFVFDPSYKIKKGQIEDLFNQADKIGVKLMVRCNYKIDIFKLIRKKSKGKWKKKN